MRKAKWIAVLLFGLLSLIGWAEEGRNTSVTGDGPSSNRNKTLSPYVNAHETVYKLSVGVSGSGSGWLFIKSATSVSGGVPDGDEEHPAYTTTLSKAKRVVADSNSPEIFTLGLSGKLTKPGGSGGGPVPWGVSTATKFYYISPYEDVIILGGSSSFSAKHNGAAHTSSWSISPTTDINGNAMSQLTGKKTITIGPQGNWFPPDGNFQVTSTGTNMPNNANATLKVVGISDLHLSRSDGFSVHSTQYKKVNAIDFYVGDEAEQSAYNIQAYPNPTLADNDLPSGWVSPSITDIHSLDLNQDLILTPVAANNKTKATLQIVDLGACWGYATIHSGGSSADYQKFIRMIKYVAHIYNRPVDAERVLWVIPSKSALGEIDLEARLQGLPSDSPYATSYELTWTVTSGVGKVSLDTTCFSSNPHKLKCRVKVVDAAHVSSAVDDVTVEVSWKTVGIKRKSTDTINFTVRTLHHLNVVSNTRSGTYPIYKWNLEYRIMDNFNTAVPNDILNTLVANESWSNQFGIGYMSSTLWNITLGSPTLSTNSLKDELKNGLFQKNYETFGGNQKITIDGIEVQNKKITCGRDLTTVQIEDIL